MARLYVGYICLAWDEISDARFWGERKATIRFATSDTVTRENIIGNFANRCEISQHGGAMRMGRSAAKVDGRCFMQRQFSLSLIKSFAYAREK